MGAVQFIGEKLGQGAGFLLNGATEAGKTAGSMVAGWLRIANGGDDTPATGIINSAGSLASTISGAASSGLADAGGKAGAALEEGLMNFKPLPTPNLVNSSREIV